MKNKARGIRNVSLMLFTAVVLAGMMPITSDCEDVFEYQLQIENGTDLTNTNPYMEGETILLKADDPKEDEQFIEWVSSAGGSFEISKNPETSFTMPDSDTTVTAVYEGGMYALTVVGEAGSGSYKEGSQIPITASPAKGQRFVKWNGAAGIIADANSASTTFTMPGAAATVSAAYEALPTYALGVVDGKDNTGRSPYLEGEKISITAADAPEGQKFKEWTSSAGGSFEDSLKKTTTFTIPANETTVTAVFEPVTFTVKVTTSPQNSGTITGDGEAAYDSTVTLAAMEQDGYVFNRWLENGSVVETSRTLVIKEIRSNHAYVAEFQKDETADSSKKTGYQNPGLGRIVVSTLAAAIGILVAVTIWVLVKKK